MRVLHVAQPVDGGVANVVIDLARDQRTRGWSPVVASPGTGKLPDRMTAAGVETRQWEAGRSPVGRASLTEASALRRIVADVHPDVVHLHGSKAGMVGRMCVRGTLPTIFQPHLWSFESEPGPTTRPARAWERFAARWTDAYVCVSDDEERTGRHAGIRGRMVVIPNGIDVDRVYPADRAAARRELSLAQRPTVVCVARLAALKGHDLLLQAWSMVLRSVPEAQLVLVGDGPLGDSLRETFPIARDASVRWIGWSDRTADFMTASDVVVVPSRAEGMALVPLEAMGCGRSVVAFNAGGIAESVGDCGAVLPIGDVSGLADQLVRRLLGGGFADAEGARGRQRVVDQFNTRKSAQAVADLVETVHRS